MTIYIYEYIYIIICVYIYIYIYIAQNMFETTSIIIPPSHASIALGALVAGTSPARPGGASNADFRQPRRRDGC